MKLSLGSDGVLSYLMTSNGVTIWVVPASHPSDSRYHAAEYFDNKADALCYAIEVYQDIVRSYSRRCYGRDVAVAAFLRAQTQLIEMGKVNE